MSTVLFRRLMLVSATAATFGAASLAYAAPAAAPAPVVSGGTMIPGLGVADMNEALGRSNAFTAAAEQRKVTYKATYDAAQARGEALGRQLNAMVVAYRAAAAKPGASPALLKPQAEAINALQESGKREIQQMLLPAQLSEAYVNEQIGDKLDAAVQAAMTKYRVTMLVQPQAIIARSTSYDLSTAISAELNTLIPAATLVPPAGWLPRELREQQAQQAAAQAAAGAAPGAPTPRKVPAGPTPNGR